MKAGTEQWLPIRTKGYTKVGQAVVIETRIRSENGKEGHAKR